MTKARSAITACLFLLVSWVAAYSQAPNSGMTAEPSPSVGQSATDSALPYTPSLNLSSMDKTIDPCVDFYQYSCGGWQKNNPIPPDQTSWSVYGKLYQDNLNFLRDILEQAAIPQKRDPITQKIGDFYGACMDEKAVNQRGLAAIQPELNAVSALQSAHDLAPLIARLHLTTQGSSMLFGGGSTQDPDNSELQIAGLDQGGLGLPDRDYYLKDDAKSKENR